MPSFTLDQRKAHDPLRHLSVTANAGSGKTRVLVNRYCDLVEFGGVMPRDIAAITFTEKAAAELRSRIAAAFEERLGDPDRRERWERLKSAREDLTSAVVATIHGFCAQLLREFPIETDVPPNFTVLSGYERSRLLEESIAETIERGLDDGDGGSEASGGGASGPASAAYQVARRIGREKMEEILRMMLGKREVIEYSRRHGVLALDREATLELWRRELESAVREILLDDRTSSAIDRLVSVLKPAERERALGLLRGIRGSGDIRRVIADARDLVTEILCTKEAKGIRKGSYAITKDEFPLLEEPITRVMASWRRAPRLFSGEAEPEHDPQLLWDARILLALYDEILRGYDARKNAVGALDFEDLQLRLLAALERPEAAARVARRFRYLMIDEFQDTNELQLAIARHMLADLRFGNLCIVGDRKQSIYGFRNADVAVFEQANREILEANAAGGFGGTDLLFRGEPVPPRTLEESLGMIGLDASFRLLPSICAYVNAACAPLIEGSAGDGVIYEPLVCARVSEGEGRVEMLLTDPPREAERNAPEPAGELHPAEPPPTEAEMIARRILSLVEGDGVVWEPGPDGVEAPRAPRFTDVAILCRKRSQFPAIERALRGYGIPFITFGGVGFYRTQEIYDLLNYLRALIDPHDEIALIGLFRSPYFCVSDAELFRLRPPRRGEETSGLWDRAERRAGSGAAEPALRRAVEMIADDRSMAGRVPISMLIRRIVERTGWRGAVIGAERGEQNLANVEKLIEIAREFEGRGFTNLFDFVERITELVEREELEGEAVVTSGRDAVRLMTMHGAKGLEFPIVILPSLHSRVRPPSEPYFDKKLGFGWNWKFNRREHRPAATVLMAIREGARNRAEEARLFYVAATRARDHLILSGIHDPDHPTTDTMLDWALAPLGSVPEEDEERVLEVEELPFLAPDGATRVTARWRLPIRCFRSVADLPRHVPLTRPPVPFRAGLVRAEAIVPRATGETYSATQILVHHQCPTKYYLAFRLGMPEEIGEAYMIDPDRRDTEEGTIYARLFRYVASRLDTVAGAAGIDPERLGALVEQALATHPLTSERQDRLRLRLLEPFLRMFTSEEVVATLFPGGARPQVEYELTMPFGEELLIGVADRVLRGLGGETSIVHFKTIDTEPGELDRLAESYLPQLRVYAYLLMRMDGRLERVAATLIFACAPELPRRTLFTRADMERIEEDIARDLAEIRELTYGTGGRLPLRTPHCPECPYWIEGACLLGREDVV